MVYIHNRILLSHKYKQNNAICSNTEGPRDNHTKWSKSDREKQTSYGITYMWNLKKKDTNELIYKTDLQTGTKWEDLKCFHHKEEMVII